MEVAWLSWHRQSGAWRVNSRYYLAYVNYARRTLILQFSYKSRIQISTSNTTYLLVITGRISAELCHYSHENAIKHHISNLVCLHSFARIIATIAIFIRNAETKPYVHKYSLFVFETDASALVPIRFQIHNSFVQMVYDLLYGFEVSIFVNSVPL